MRSYNAQGNLTGINMHKIKHHLAEIGEKRKHLEGSAHKGIKGLVSVCIPNFNKGIFIYDTIKSVAEQTWPNVEICIVDDFSTDNSRSEINRALKDFNIPHKKIFLPKRTGTAWAQNIAYYLSEGEFIANLDSDDLSAPDRLSKQVKMMVAEDFDLVGANFSVFRNNWKMPEVKDGGCWLKYDPEEILDSYLVSGIHCVCFGTALFTRKVLEVTGGMDKSLIGTEDYGFIDKVAARGFSIGNSRDVLYHYRNNGTQRSKLFHGSSV